MKQIEVKIMQQSYLLSCPEGQEPRMLDAVERVDAAMTRIRDAGKVRARERIAVLAALNMAFEIADHETAAVAAREQAEALIAAAAAAPVAIAAPDSASREDDEARVRSLLQRLDETLGDDGRLL
ncbi:cell division protein ZapA [Diaphorobacter aerolatus]|uniref:Cell division protein ZapA n=1 Tax=Diaphorobacter aerolatus TaxID=1288495 RepID=A0A7H0GJ52_9BURK|nr:cell division protein ZapA [Diaphorobacter aerolatus]QNP48318.1 cell division protein ZapA [Diaphorobacter aerolatus]